MRGSSFAHLTQVLPTPEQVEAGFTVMETLADGKVRFEGIVGVHEDSWAILSRAVYLNFSQIASRWGAAGGDRVCFAGARGAGGCLYRCIHVFAVDRGGLLRARGRRAGCPRGEPPGGARGEGAATQDHKAEIEKLKRRRRRSGGGEAQEKEAASGGGRRPRARSAIVCSSLTLAKTLVIMGWSETGELGHLSLYDYVYEFTIVWYTVLRRELFQDEYKFFRRNLLIDFPTAAQPPGLTPRSRQIVQTFPSRSALLPPPLRASQLHQCHPRGQSVGR